MQLSIRASLAIHCLILVSEFGETDKITSEKIALSTGTNPVAIRSIMSALKKDGILNVKNGTGGTTLNMPPEEITVYRICNAVKPQFCKNRRSGKCTWLAWTCSFLTRGRYGRLCLEAQKKKIRLHDNL